MHKALTIPLLAFSLNLSAAEETGPTTMAILDNHAVYGHVETVALLPGGIKTKARLDTGAARSSLYARDPEVFEKKGKEYVRFTFVDHKGKKHRLSRPLVSTTTVRQASGRQTRYVVEMGLCLGEHFEKTHFTLADRRHLSYPILVGRNFLKNSVLVSSTHKMTAKPECGTDA